MIFRYLLVGGVAAIVDLAFFTMFGYYLGFNYLLIGCIGFVIATFVNYQLSIRLVFQQNSRFSKGKELSAVYLVSAIGLLFHASILWLAVEMLMLPLLLSKISATASVFFWNYLTRKHFIFRQPSKHATN